MILPIQTSGESPARIPPGDYFLRECLAALRTSEESAPDRLRWAGKMFYRAVTMGGSWGPALDRRAQEIVRELDLAGRAPGDLDELAAEALCYKLRRFLQDVRPANGRRPQEEEKRRSRGPDVAAA